MPQLIQLQSPYLPGQDPYSIFQNRIAAVDHIAKKIKEIRIGKYWNGFIDSVNKTISDEPFSGEVEKLEEQITNRYAPDDVVNPNGMVEEFSEKFVDDYVKISQKNQALEKQQGLSNALQGQGGDIQQIGNSLLEQAGMSGQTGTGGVSAGTGQSLPNKPSGEVQMPNDSMAQLWQQIKSLPLDGVDFSPILEYMGQNRPANMGEPTGLEQSIFSGAINQKNANSPRNVMSQNMDMFDTMRKIMYPNADAKELAKFNQGITQENAEFNQGITQENAEFQQQLNQENAIFSQELDKEFTTWLQDTSPTLEEVQKQMPEGFKINSYNINKDGTKSFQVGSEQEHVFNSTEEAQAWISSNKQENVEFYYAPDGSGGYDLGVYTKTGTTASTDPESIAQYGGQFSNIQEFNYLKESLQAQGVDTSLMTDEWAKGQMMMTVQQYKATMELAARYIGENRGSEVNEQAGMTYSELYSDASRQYQQIKTTLADEFGITDIGADPSAQYLDIEDKNPGTNWSFVDFSKLGRIAEKAIKGSEHIKISPDENDLINKIMLNANGDPDLALKQLDGWIASGTTLLTHGNEELHFDRENIRKILEVYKAEKAERMGDTNEL